MSFNEKDAQAIIKAQRQFYFSGETKSVDTRKVFLENLRKSIIRHEDEIVEALYKDLGKSEFEAYVTEVGLVISSLSEMIKNVDKWTEPERAKTPLYLRPAKSYVVREPYGSVLIIGPFNYPFQLMMEPLVGAIVGGNCAVVKPSELATHTAAVVRKILEETFPPEYVMVIEGEKEVTEILTHAPFDYIFFTGSTNVGKIIMKAAAERLTPVTLELGGKSPVIVDQTAKLSYAAERLVWGKFLNIGQTCVAPDYLLVHHSVKDKLISKIIDTIERFYGKDSSVSPDYGKMINKRHFNRIKTMIEREGENVIYGGQSNEEKLWIAPTLVDHVQWENPSMADEIFGPVLPILTYDNLGEAVHRVRQLSKPLAAYMFTENSQAANFFIENLPFGGGCINDTISHVGNTNLPFGGVGASGMNEYHGKASFELFTHPKAMMERNTTIPMKVALPPYNGKLKYVKPLLR